MTLALALLNSDQVVVLADRRVTPTRGGKPEDESNKMAVFNCRDGRLAVAFAGLAQVGRNRTALWLLDLLDKASAPDCLMGPTVERLTSLAESRWRRSASPARMPA